MILTSTSRSRRRSCFACMEAKTKCDRQIPCAKCVSKGTTCTYGPTTQKIPAAATSPKTNCSSVDNVSTTEEEYSQAQTAASARTATSITTSHLNKAGETISTHPDHLSDTSIMPSSSVSSRTSETIYSLQSSGLVYVQDPKVYQQQTELTRPLEPTSHPSRTTNPSDYSSVAIYNSGFLNEPLVYSPTGSNLTHADNQLAPISSHLSPAYGSDVFTPFFTDIFPQMTSTSALTEVTLNIDELNVKNSPDNFPFDAQLFVDSTSPATNQNSSPQTEMLKPGAFQDFEVDRDIRRLRLVNVEPTPVELQHYCECHNILLLQYSGNQCLLSARLLYNILETNPDRTCTDFSSGVKVANLAQRHAGMWGLIYWIQAGNQFHLQDTCLRSGDACA